MDRKRLLQRWAMNPGRLFSFLYLIGRVVQRTNVRRQLLTVSHWLGVALLAAGILFLLEAVQPVGLVNKPSAITLATPLQDMSRIPGFELPVLTPAPPDLSPYALLVKSDETMNRLHSLTEVQRLVGSSGPGATATFVYQAPDRLRYQVIDGLQSIAIGDAQYYLGERQTWEKAQRAEPFRWPNFTYANNAANAKLEGLALVDGELCAVVSFEASHVDLYRQWIGLTSGWRRRQQMFAPGHHMLSTFSQYNAPLQITPPPSF